jgi:hypothetical protein
MPDHRPADAGDDAAWVVVGTPLAPPDLIALAHDPQRLMRVNSQWVFDAWEQLPADRCRFRIDNRSNGQVWQTEVRIERLADGLRLDYASGIKASTRLRVEPVEGGSRLWIIDDYGRLPPSERAARVAEVDRSLAQWGRDLYRHLQAWARWSRFAPWRWYVEKRWLRMTPRSRRIVWLLLWTTPIELALLTLLVAILVVERAR